MLSLCDANWWNLAFAWFVGLFWALLLRSKALEWTVPLLEHIWWFFLLFGVGIQGFAPNPIEPKLRLIKIDSSNVIDWNPLQILLLSPISYLFMSPLVSPLQITPLFPYIITSWNKRSMASHLSSPLMPSPFSQFFTLLHNPKGFLLLLAPNCQVIS